MNVCENLDMSIYDYVEVCQDLIFGYMCDDEIYGGQVSPELIEEMAWLQAGVARCF